MDPKLKTWGIAIGVLVMVLALVDFVALKGESVGGGSVSLQAEATPLALSITRIGEEHLVQIKTRKEVRGESKGRAIAYRLMDPSGVTIVEDSEILSHKQRYFSFTPTEPGDYTLHVEGSGLIGSGRGTGYVSVAVNDRRVISRLLGF